MSKFDRRETKQYYVVEIDKSLQPSEYGEKNHPYSRKHGQSRVSSNYKVEAGNWNDDFPLHGLVQAVHETYSHHYTLILKPTDIWQVICESLSKQVSSNAEKYRSMLVDHEGKKKLIVRRDDFVLGSKHNDWSPVFEEFSQKILANSQQNNPMPSLMVQPFESSSALSQLVSHITLMDAMQHYFQYELHTKCGIPFVCLQGPETDWTDLQERVDRLDLASIDLQYWKQPLQFFVHKLVQSRQGNPDLKFWKSFYKYQTRSGGDSISGFILLLFPELVKRCLPNNGSLLSSTTRLNELYDCFFPMGVVSAPFIWEYFDQRIPMRLFAGFGDCKMNDKDHSVETTLGWKVVYDTN